VGFSHLLLDPTFDTLILEGLFMTAAKKIDSKGRLLLGEELAGTTVLVEKLKNGQYVVKPAVVIPASEKWLFENEEALNSVMLGLKQSREGKTAENPAFAKKNSWKDELED
jgi:hypothetical protein